MLAERSCVYNMLINLMETREAGKRLIMSLFFCWERKYAEYVTSEQQREEISKNQNSFAE